MVNQPAELSMKNVEHTTVRKLSHSIEIRFYSKGKKIRTATMFAGCRSKANFLIQTGFTHTKNPDLNKLS